MTEVWPEEPHRHAEMAARWERLLHAHQRLLDQPVSDAAREWMGDQLMVLALSADIERALARGDLDTANELYQVVAPYIDRASREFHIEAPPGDPTDH